MLLDQGNVLLAVGRAVIAQALNLDFQYPVDESASWLQDWGASFVTLTQHQELRGCIGSLEAYRPLVADVRSNAVSAALHDPRFLPLSADEFETIAIEVSILSPTQRIAALNEADAIRQMRPGIDGIVLEYGRYRSTFLPQVWDELEQPQQFLAMLKRKAGLPVDFWAADLKLARYTVSKWRETDGIEDYRHG